jgi:hypothetical protein
MRASFGGKLVDCTPAEAAENRADFRSFTKNEGSRLGAFCEALVPGARGAGCAYFIDHHVAVRPSDSPLMLRYLGIAPLASTFTARVLLHWRV